MTPWSGCSLPPKQLCESREDSPEKPVTPPLSSKFLGGRGVLAFRTSTPGCCSCLLAHSTPQHPRLPWLDFRAGLAEVRVNAAHSSVSDSTPQNAFWTHFPRESLMGFVVPKPQAMPHFHPLMQAIYQETLTEQGGFLTRGSWEQSANTPHPSLRPPPVLCIPGNVNREASARSPPRT